MKFMLVYNGFGPYEISNSGKVLISLDEGPTLVMKGIVSSYPNLIDLFKLWQKLGLLL